MYYVSVVKSSCDIFYPTYFRKTIRDLKASIIFCSSLQFIQELFVSEMRALLFPFSALLYPGH